MIRTSARTVLLVVFWLIFSVAVWNGFFDLYVSRGAREYLQLQAEFELGRGPAPAMAEVMARASRDGVRGASIWAALVLAAGWATVAAGAAPKRERA
jgi:hypothetical protein